MRFHSVLRGVVATVFVLTTSSLASFGHQVALQPAMSKGDAAPAPGEAMQGYRAVDGWVRSWTLPTAPPAELGSLSNGAHVQLRLDGELVGRGQAFAVPGEPGGTALLTATREAMRAAEARMRLPNDAMRDAALKELASRIMISLDLAGPLILFEPSTWAEAELGLSPGLEGVATAVRGGDGLTGMLASAFPSLLISTNTLPHRALGGLCAQTIGEGGAAAALEQPKQIRERHGLRMYRFRTTHLAQCKPGAEPVFLYRGARLIDQSEMTAAELRGMAEGMVRHMNFVRPPNLGRTLSLSTATYSECRPHKESLALRLIALRAVMDAEKAGIAVRAGQEARAAWQTAASWIASLTDSQDGDEAAAMFLLAIANPVGAEPGMPANSASGSMTFVTEPARWVGTRSWADGGMLAEIPPAVQAVGALAYAIHPRSSRFITKGESQARSFAEHEAEIRNWIGRVPHEQLVSHMPWLGWAEIELARHKAQAGGKPADIPSAVALREMRKQVWEHQIGVSDIDKDSMDLAGGIVFTKAASPLPTWQCTRPLAFIATMLADERLTEPQERAIELARLLQSLRFIRQLQADESIGWMAPNVEMAIGGVRAAPWDQSMPSDATSMALLTVVEALRSLDALSKPAVVAPEAALPAADAPAANP